MPTTFRGNRVLTEEQCNFNLGKLQTQVWCCNFRIRDEPELREIADIRGSRCKITEYHGKYLLIT